MTMYEAADCTRQLSTGQLTPYRELHFVYDFFSTLYDDAVLKVCFSSRNYIGSGYHLGIQKIRKK